MQKNEEPIVSIELAALKDDQHFWNLILTTLFGVLLLASVYYFYRVEGATPSTISLFDFLLLSLAVFRITRLIVYDKITRFIRDFLLASREFVGADGLVYIERRPRKKGPLRTISDLINCPWCTGMWVTLFVVFFYYTSPHAWYIIVLFAIAGAGNGLMLVANVIGWRAENLKIDAVEKEDHNGH